MRRAPHPTSRYVRHRAGILSFGSPPLSSNLTDAPVIASIPDPVGAAGSHLRGEWRAAAVHRRLPFAAPHGAKAMPETEGNPARPPRFPFVAAALCAACVGAAGWTWMRFSYAWDVTAWQLPHAWVLAVGDDYREEYSDWPTGTLVSLRGSVVRQEPVRFCLRDGSSRLAECALIKKLVKTDRGIIDAAANVVLVELSEDDPCPIDENAEFIGRLRVVAAEVDITPGAQLHYRICTVDAAASRFHAASITGLAVGAMGVFVFAVYLRHWLKERGAFGKQARA